MSIRKWSVGCVLGALIAVTTIDESIAQVRNDELYASVLEGTAAKLISSFDTGMSPNEAIYVPGSSQTISLLELSVRAANDDATSELLRRGAEPKLEGTLSGRPLIDVLSQQGLTKSLRLLILREPSMLLASDTSPLLLAIGYNRSETARALVEWMLSYLPTDRLQAALNEALVIAGTADADPDLVQDLLDAGADARGTDALIAAAAGCSASNVGLVLAEGADPNRRYESKHVAEYALDCFGEGNVAQDVREFLALVRLLHDAGSDICPYAADPLVTTAAARQVVQEAGMCPQLR